MVSKKKIETVKSLEKQFEEFSVIGMLDMHKLPARQLHYIRNKLRGKIVIRMAKKKVMAIALKNKGITKLDPYIQGEPALFLSNEDLFRIARVLQVTKSEAPARPGDISPRDIVIKEGPTPLPPGPVIGELQKLKIPAGVEGDKIVVKKDTTLVKEGDEITQPVADMLLKLNIQPMEIGLNLIAALEGGIVYEKSILFVPEDHYINLVKEAAARAFSLSISLNIINSETLPFLLSKANREAEALALEANIITPSTVGQLLAKATAQAKSLQG